jgi:long-chain fatty acid transport protein
MLSRMATGLLLAAVQLGAGGGSAGAGGFAITEQAASSAGFALAGVSAWSGDASTVFFNPAGMSRLEDPEVASAAHLIWPDNGFRNRGSFDPAGNPVAGSGSIDNVPALLGDLFAVMPVTERIHLGIGITAPFGLSSNYDDDWPGRYNTLRSAILTVDVNPAIAVRLDEHVTIGFGASLQYARGERRNALDLGSLCPSVLGVTPADCAAIGLVPQGADGSLFIEADGWAAGFNAGVLVELPPVRLGLAYRSEMHHNLEGDADFSVPAVAQPITLGGNLFVDTNAAAEIVLPETVRLDAAIEAGDGWTLLAGVTWTRWSRFKSLVVEFDNPNQPTVSQAESWRDTFRYAVGAEWKLDDMITLRGGGAYEETPTRDTTRNPGIPQGDRHAVAVGAGFALLPQASLDLAYSYNWESNADVEQARADFGVVTGTWDNSVHVVSAQLNWRF